MTIIPQKYRYSNINLNIHKKNILILKAYLCIERNKYKLEHKIFT